MLEIQDVFSPVLGELVWSVRPRYGSFITMEFGIPHLRVREPVNSRADDSPTVGEALSRRRVTISGEWHFWVQHSKWEIVTAHHRLTSEQPLREEYPKIMSELEGQKLVSVVEGNVKNSAILRFDMGGMLSISPSGQQNDPQWSLHRYKGDIFVMGNDGNLERIVS